MPRRRFLLDSHAFFWWLSSRTERIPQNLESVLSDLANDVYVSSVTCMELITKFRLGKLQLAPEIASDIESSVLEAGFLTLPMTFSHAQRTGALPLLHRDPWDRLLIAQAFEEDLTLVSNEVLFDAYRVPRVWSMAGPG